MATINVATKEYALTILGESVVSGIINASGRLILTRDNGETFDGGDFNAAIDALIDANLATQTLNDITISSSAIAKVALKTKGFAGQTANLQEWQNSAGTIIAKVDKDGKFTAVALVGTTIDGALNTHSNINAAKVDGRKITVNTTAPATPAVNDIWINPSGS